MGCRKFKRGAECVALTLPQTGRVFGGEVRLGKTVKDEFEIGRILHLKSKIGNRRSDKPDRTRQSNLSFPISDLRCRIRPISNFFLRLNRVVRS
jgi:hypothetical protein